ncbi:MAG: thioredoxin fold domain-containing protein [Desulfobacteraceae bacterium]|nr:thioredoxin fold domain-containing protein [Desulfobacteraceae bacterium]
MKKEYVLVIVLVAIGLSGLWWFTNTQSVQIEPAPAGSTAPAMVTETVTSRVTDSTGINWKDYTPGLAQAKNQDKNVFLYFYAQWCTYCTKLKQTTFLDERVQTYLEKNFISISVDTDQNQSLSQSWQVKGLPTMWFLTPDGNKINSLPGYVDGSQLFHILRYIHTNSYDTMSFQDFVKLKQ